MDDIQSWWEVPSIAHFCSLFRVAFNLLDFDIEELEEALLTDGTEFNGSSLLQDLIVRLLCGCLGHNGISTFNYQMFLRRLFRSKCKEQGRENPFNTDIDFQFLPLRTKVEILHALCDFRLDADDVIDVLKNLDSDSLRVHPLGHDESKSAYWYFYGTRLYKEEYPKKRKKKKDHEKSKKKRKEGVPSSSDEDYERRPSGSWKVMCYTEDDWRELTRSMANSNCREERALYTVLSEDFLPEIPRLFEEKEKLQRKRAAEQMPRRASRRLAKQEEQPKSKDDRYSERERVNREKMEQRERQARYAMKSESESEDGSSLSESAFAPTVGRQTNNSLSSATGEIFIQPSRQKFRTTQLFRRTREDLMTGMYKILDRIKAHDDAWPFLDPVNEDYAPKYYSVIAKPMDLQTMEDKLDNGEYGSLQQFKADFQLIVDNCRQYNGSDNEYTEMVRRLQEAFEACAERYLDADHSSSDDDMPPLIHHRQHDLTSESSLSPLNRPRSRSTSQGSSLGNESEAKEVFVKEEVKEVSFLNRNNKVDKSRLRRKQKRRKKNTKMSTNDETDESSDDVFLEQRRNHTNYSHHDPPRNHSSRGFSSDRFDMKTSSSRDTSKDRSKFSKTFKDRSRNRVRMKRKGVPKKDRRKEKLSSDDTSSEASKERLSVNKPNSRETSKDRSRDRVKVNYKERETSESEIFTDSSDDSHYDSKLKAKASSKKPVKRAGVIKNVEAIEALELATEQTLKDINKWLDETPRFSDFSSCSNSPLHMPYMDDMATIEGEYRRRLLMDRPIRPRDRFSNELHRRRMFKEQMGLKRRREIQRTIDRLQPGKSKGNLLSKENHQNHVDAAGSESKAQSNENDENAPKISLGKVLPSDLLSFGIGETAKKESEDDCTQDKLVIEEPTEVKEKEDTKEEHVEEETKSVLVEPEVKPVVEPIEQKKEKPTPNLSAWFKAFGAPKAQPPTKKKAEPEEKAKDDDVDEEKRINVGIQSPARRQRKASTGSSVSERSSFSIEPVDGSSPRQIIDEPYVSPQQEMKSYHHSPINGTIKVGFYQDTCFPRGTSEKSSSPRDPIGCSPRELPCMSPRSPPYSPRDYPNASPRSPYCSPRHIPMSPGPREYPRELPPNASPRDYPHSPREIIAHSRDYHCTSPKEPAPMSPYRSHPSPHPPHTTPIYHYPAHLSPYYDSNKSIEFRNNDNKVPMSSYPVKKRAYNEIDNSVSKPNEVPAYKGGSFTPTREAMEQERTFTPTPGRMPGPSQSIRVPESPIAMALPHSLHYDPYVEERRIASPYYTADYTKTQPSSPHPIFPQSTSVISPNYRRDPTLREEFDRPGDRELSQSYQVSRSSTPSYPGSPRSEAPRSVTPLMTYSSRPSTPARNASPPSLIAYPSRPSTPARNVSPTPLMPYPSRPSTPARNVSPNPVMSYTSRPSTPARNISPTPLIPYTSRPSTPARNVSPTPLMPYSSRPSTPAHVSPSPLMSYSSRPSTPAHSVSPSPLMAYSSRPSTPAHNVSPTSSPINYSNTNSDTSKDQLAPPKIINHTSDVPSLNTSVAYSKTSDISLRKVNSPASPISYASSGRINDGLSPKVSNAYNRALSDLPHGLNYSGQDLSKISVPLSYSNQSELLSSKMNYSHPMAELSARYNYQMSELMQGKPAVYNHPMQDFMQGKAGAYSNMNIPSFGNRPISEIMQSKVNEMQAREMAFSPRSVPSAKPEPAPTKTKKSRKKKNEVPSGFQQYVAPTSEPISLKSTSSVPGSAFNFGPQLKETYGQYLDEIRSSYFVSHPEASSGKGTPHTAPYFLGHASTRTPPAYHHPLMSAQYQQYLQRHPEELLRPMVLHQGLIPHSAGYPHAYLGMHDAINRPSWL